MLYVGQASGAEGFWGRRSEYSATAHGGNKNLVREFGIDASPERQKYLRFFRAGDYRPQCNGR